MKKSFVILLLVMAGCYSPQKYPLQPNEKVIFSTPERANGFRQASGNDQWNTNRIVNITRPTLILCE